MWFKKKCSEKVRLKEKRLLIEVRNALEERLLGIEKDVADLYKKILENDLKHVAIFKRVDIRLMDEEYHRMKQISCSEQGHDLRYVNVECKVKDGKSSTLLVNYICRKCNMETDKFLDEMTDEEKDALRTLGVLKD